jgi:hypothetical protein
MHYLTITGAIIVLVGTAIGLVGSYIEAKDSEKSDIEKTNIISDLREQFTTFYKPDIQIVGLESSKNDIVVVVKNCGTKPATKLKLIFTDDSYPDAFAANIISGCAELVQSSEYRLGANLFTGINTLLKLPNSEPDYVKKLENDVSMFESGKKSFIPRFYIEYYFENKKMQTEKYMMLISKHEGVQYFGKDK